MRERLNATKFFKCNLDVLLNFYFVGYIFTRIRFVMMSEFVKRIEGKENLKNEST